MDIWIQEDPSDKIVGRGFSPRELDFEWDPILAPLSEGKDGNEYE